MVIWMVCNSNLEFLNNALLELLDHVAGNIKHSIWYQYDGASCHLLEMCVIFLIIRFLLAGSAEEVRVGLWYHGFVKNYVSEEESTTQEEMKNRIAKGSARNFLKKFEWIFATRCLETNRRNFEHLSK